MLLTLLVIAALVFFVGFFAVGGMGMVERRLQRRAEIEAARQRHPSSSNVTPIAGRRSSYRPPEQYDA